MKKSKQKKKPSLTSLRTITKKIPFDPGKDKLWEQAALIESREYHLFAAILAMKEFKETRNDSSILKAQRHLALLSHYEAIKD